MFFLSRCCASIYFRKKSSICNNRIDHKLWSNKWKSIKSLIWNPLIYIYQMRAKKSCFESLKLYALPILLLKSRYLILLIPKINNTDYTTSWKNDINKRKGSAYFCNAASHLQWGMEYFLRQFSLTYPFIHLLFR